MALSTADPALTERPGERDARRYHALRLIRRVEEAIERLYWREDEPIKSPVHLSIGQESVAVAVCEALRADDLVFGTYRGHAAYLAHGGSLERLWAELYGKATGAARGKAGSMHLIDAANGVMGMSAVVGTTIPHAVGAAYAQTLRGTSRLAVAFFGDGASEEGVFFESLNFATLHDLPVLFVCENNGLAIHTRTDQRQKAGTSIATKAAAFGLPVTVLEDDGFDAVAEAAASAVERIRRGEGPQLLEVRMLRWRAHVGPGEDFAVGFRTREEAEPWLARDQVAAVGERLAPEVRAAIDARVEAEIEAAVAFAEASPWPEPAELTRDVYAPRSVTLAEPFRASAASAVEGRRLTYGDALCEATTQAMERSPDPLVLGLGVNDVGRWIYGTTRGLADRFGPARCLDMPLSEDAMTGVAIGMAYEGLRPVYVHIRQDFLLLCMNQLVNIAAKAHYMYGGQVRVPLVVRSVIGKSWGQGAQHSQALHALFAHVPGLRVVLPSTPFDAKGALLEAIQDDNPVIFIEHRLLHFREGFVPEQPYSVPFGRARVLAEGTDVTIVGISWMAVEALRARALLGHLGISAEVIDPISISPLDHDTILRSAARTGRLVVADTAWTHCGASAEIVARAAEAGVRGPDGRPLLLERVGFAPTTCPPSPPLERLFYPDGRALAERIARGLGVDPAPLANLPDSPDPAETEFKGPF